MKIPGIKISGLYFSPTVLYILVFVAFISLLRFHFDPLYIISWDVFGYYLYLPSAFIHHDPFLANPAWVQQLLLQYHVSPTLYQLKTTPGGTFVDLYTMGMAMAYFPAFLLGHWLAFLLHYPADGFSLPYQYAMAVEGLIALLLSLILLRKLLRIWLSENTTLLTLVILTLGTNYLEMAFGYYHSPHGFIFLAYTLILWLTVQWHDRPSLKQAVSLGLLIGWITLARPVEIVALFIPLCWGVGSRFSPGKKVKFFIKHKLSLLLFILCAFLVVLPQLIYWKTVTGHWLWNTYITGSEGMDFLSPHTLNFLFSFRKGWLVYTPLMLFSFPGLVLLYQRNRGLFWPFFFFLYFFIYLYSSWSIWWYAFCFSQRVMVQAYPVLAILLGFTLAWIANLSWKWRYTLSVLIVSLLFLNIFQTWQYSFAKILDGSRMTKAYYCMVFGKTAATEEDRKLLLVDRSNTDTEVFSDSLHYDKKILLSCDFENKEGWFDQRSGEQAKSGLWALKMDSTHVFTRPFRFCYDDLTKKDHAWLRISFWVFPEDDVVKNPFSLVVLTEHAPNLPPYKYRTANIENPLYKVCRGQWNKVVFDYMTPEVRSVRDTIAVYFWHRGKMPVYVDDFSMEAFSPSH